DLDGRVGVDRKALLFDFHRHDAGVAFARDLGDLADVDARDAHRRLGVDVHRRVELRLQLEAVFERDVLGEAEVDRHRGDQREHDREFDRAAPAQFGDGGLVAAPPEAHAAHFFVPFFFGCLMPSASCWAVGYGSPNRLLLREVNSVPEATFATLPITAV